MGCEVENESVVQKGLVFTNKYRVYANSFSVKHRMFLLWRTIHTMLQSALLHTGVTLSGGLKICFRERKKGG